MYRFYLNGYCWLTTNLKISIHPMYRFYELDPEKVEYLKAHFNTSYVSVLRAAVALIISKFERFQYILYVSVLRYRPRISPCPSTKFQYILCIGFTSNLLSKLVATLYFNTSYVSVLPSY